MKYKIDGYSTKEIIDHYDKDDELITVTNLDGTQHSYPLESEEKVEAEMYKQGRDYIKIKEDRFTTVVICLFLLSCFGLFAIECGLAAIATALLAVLETNPYALIGTTFMLGGTYLMYRIDKYIAKGLKNEVLEYEYKDKYELYFENEDKLKTYQEVVQYNQTFDNIKNDETETLENNKGGFTGRINEVDTITLKQMRDMLVEISNYNKIVKEYNTEEAGYSKSKK